MLIAFIRIQLHALWHIFVPGHQIVEFWERDQEGHLVSFAMGCECSEFGKSLEDAFRGDR